MGSTTAAEASLKFTMEHDIGVRTIIPLSSVYSAPSAHLVPSCLQGAFWSLQGGAFVREREAAGPRAGKANVPLTSCSPPRPELSVLEEGMPFLIHIQPYGLVWPCLEWWAQVKKVCTSV